MADTEAQATDTYDEALDLVDVDSNSIYQDVITSLESGVGEPLYPGDERRIFGEALVAVLVAYMSKANDASRQTLLRYARGQVLDAIGERLGVERIDATPATTTVKFELSAEQGHAITIPAMTRVTSDGQLYFATDEPCVIASGETAGTVTASCTEAGSAGNGLLAGTLTTLVDLQPYVATVTNTTPTDGGDDGEPYTTEGDDRLRERIRLAPNALSVAGPEQAYVYWAMTADPGIVDVAAFSDEYDDAKTVPVTDGKAFVGGDLLDPEALLTVEGQSTGFTYTYEDSLLTITLGEADASKESVDVVVHRHMDGRVKVVPLMEGGELPDEGTLEAVAAAVNDSAIRPMTDVVTGEAPTPVDYTISLKYWATIDAEAAVVEAVEGPGGAIDRYVADQSAKLGRDVEPDVLKTYVMQAGALRCDVTAPTRTAVSGLQVARLTGSPTVTHEVETQAGWSD